MKECDLAVWGLSDVLNFKPKRCILVVKQIRKINHDPT